MSDSDLELEQQLALHEQVEEHEAELVRKIAKARREHIAALCLSALVSNADWDPTAAAAQSVFYADTLIAELDKDE